MDGQRRYLHDVADVEQVEPFALVQIAQEDLHVQRLVFVEKQISICASVFGRAFRRWLLASFEHAWDIFVLYHAILNLLHDREDSKRCAFQHGDRVVVVNQVSLRARLTH